MKIIFLALFLLGVIQLYPSEDGKAVRYFNGRVLRGHQLVQEDLWVAGGKVIPPRQTPDEEIDVRGLIIAPGYIDLQINGAFGIDFSLQPEKINDVAKLLPRYGVTAFLPTIISSSHESYRHIFSHLRDRTFMPKIAANLGLHLEGPFFNPKFCGAHETCYIRTFEEESIEEFFSDMEAVKIITLAPEVQGASKLIGQLRQKNIIVSVGHSNATYEEMEEAMKNGASFVTHLFNAMTPFHHRNPGIIGAVLTNPNMYYSVIADGHHLHPATLRMAWRSHPEGLVLVSDAIEALGLPSGSYRLGTKEIEVKNDKAYVAGTKVLAGSVLSMDAAVRYLRSCTGCSIPQALEAASYKPAQVLGIKTKGTLEEGADADFLFLDDDLYVRACFIAGQQA